MKSIFRVTMLVDGKWERWNNYASYEDAELTARGLVLSKKIGTTRCHILEVREDGGKIVAEVGIVMKAGHPHAEVRKF
jgi:hypothetical protein